MTADWKHRARWHLARLRERLTLYRRVAPLVARRLAVRVQLALPSLLATAALAAIGVGCWMERPSCGLIVPGVIIFGCLAFRRIRGD